MKIDQITEEVRLEGDDNLAVNVVIILVVVNFDLDRRSLSNYRGVDNGIRPRIICLVNWRQTPVNGQERPRFKPFDVDFAHPVNRTPSCACLPKLGPLLLDPC